MTRAISSDRDDVRLPCVGIDMKVLRRRLKRYGLTIQDYLDLLDAQGSACQVCRRTFTRNRPACVDHDHRTGEVRGLLCSPCNRTIGELHEDAEWLQRAHDHLTDPVSRHVFDTPRRHVDAPPED